MWIINSIYERVCGLISPPSCFICKKGNSLICQKCSNNFSLCLYQRNSFTYSHYSYKDKNIQKIIKSVKYYHRKDLLKGIIAPAIKDISNFINEDEKENQLLVPIPMTSLREYLRGGNHSKEITKILGEELNITYAFDLLKRKKYTKRQVAVKSLTNRLKNQKRSFTLENIEKYKYKKIILIDDVITTGATCDEAKNTLKDFGFINIKVITLAH